MQGLKLAIGIITFAGFAFVGHTLGGVPGAVVAVFLWLVGLGSIGIVDDVEDAASAAREED